VIVAVLFIDSNTRIVTQYYDVQTAKIPSPFDGYRIALLSDIHNKEFGSENEKLLAAVSGAKPNIIAVTGDLIDGDGQLDRMLVLMGRLSDIAPTYYVTGNHEWATSDARELLRRLPEYGVTVLENKYEVITIDGETITLVGFGDPNGPADQPTREDVMNGIPQELRDGYVVALNHRNMYFEQMATLGVDLILCGHAHGGTIRLPGTDGLRDHSGWFPTRTNGLYDAEYNGASAVALVSRGLGNAYHVPRFMNNPHVAVAVLRP
jgi:predicted MPP superfamily phosphohydrolase